MLEIESFEGEGKLERLGNRGKQTFRSPPRDSVRRSRARPINRLIGTKETVGFLGETGLSGSH